MNIPIQRRASIVLRQLRSARTGVNFASVVAKSLGRIIQDMTDRAKKEVVRAQGVVDSMLSEGIERPDNPPVNDDPGDYEDIVTELDKVVKQYVQQLARIQQQASRLN